MKERKLDHKKGGGDVQAAREAEEKRRQLARCFAFLAGPKRLPPPDEKRTYTEEELLAELEQPG